MRIESAMTIAVAGIRCIPAFYRAVFRRFVRKILPPSPVSFEFIVRARALFYLAYADEQCCRLSLMAAVAGINYQDY